MKVRLEHVQEPGGHMLSTRESLLLTAHGGGSFIYMNPEITKNHEIMA